MIRRKTVILISIFICLLAGVGGFFLTKIITENDAKKQGSDAEFLVNGGKWVENDSDGKVVWQFEKDGTCKITTNGDEFFDCQWYLDGDTLGIKTAWIVDLEDEFSIKIDRDKFLLTTVSKSDKNTSEFHAENDTRAK